MMKRLRIAGIALTAAGALGLLLDAFTYTREDYRLRTGGLELAPRHREPVRFPVWLSLGAMVAGDLLLLAPRRKHGA